ncbi:sensor histidine kinase [Arthrobacter sp. KN11-1C]|uniref:sensor histidine kinase n=1 Tax=Arthrobacter sp. KN11-1C TaxID=3445774 RepID=UPI003FA1116F
MRILRGFARQWGALVVAAAYLAYWYLYLTPSYGGFWGWPVAHTLIIFTAAIAVSARYPVLSLAAVGGFLLAQGMHWVNPVFSEFWTMNLAVPFAVFFVAYNGDRWVRWAGLGLSPVYAGVMSFLLLSRQYTGYSAGQGFVMINNWAGPNAMVNYWAAGASLLLVIMLVCWLAGYLIRNFEERALLAKERTAAQASLHAAEVDLIVEQERSRISRDLHDVLAHSLAVIVAQADGSRYVSRELQPPVRLALEHISNSARKALVEAQRVIDGGVRDGLTAPQPGLGDVGALVHGMAGQLALSRTVSGTPVELGAGQQLAVYRIVQESLTNALKHGELGAAVRVHFDWSGPGLAIQVISSTAADRERQDASTIPGMGRGLPGMRERARLAGGWLTAEPDDGEFLVNAFIPYGPPVLSSAAGPGEEEAASVPAELAGLGGDTHE